MTIFRKFILMIILSELIIISSCTTNPHPVEIVSVQGPLEPINPGGPIVAITLENTSTKPVTSLTATLKINRDFTFEFDVSSLKSLAPGENIISRQTLIGGGYNNDVSYPVQVKGTFEDNSKFDFTKRVQITEVTPTPFRNLSEEEKAKAVEIALHTPEAQAQLDLGLPYESSIDWVAIVWQETSKPREVDVFVDWETGIPADIPQSADIYPWVSLTFGEPGRVLIGVAIDLDNEKAVWVQSMGLKIP